MRFASNKVPKRILSKFNWKFMFLSKTKLIRQECRLIKKEKKNKKRHSKRNHPTEYRSHSRPSSRDFNPAQESDSKHLSKTIQSAHHKYNLMKSQNHLLPPRQPKLAMTQGRNSKIGLCRQMQISVSGSRSRSNYSASKYSQTEQNQISRPPSLSKNMQYPRNNIHYQSKPEPNKNIKQFIHNQLKPSPPFPYKLPQQSNRIQMCQQLDDLQIPLLSVVEVKPTPAQAPKKVIKQQTKSRIPTKSMYNQYQIKQTFQDDDELQQIKFQDKKSSRPLDNPYKPTFKQQPIQKQIKKVSLPVPPKTQVAQPSKSQDSRIDLKQQKKNTKKQVKESQLRQTKDETNWQLVIKKVQLLNDLVKHIVEHREYLDKAYPRWICASLQIYRKFIYYRQHAVALLKGKNMAEFQRFYFKRVQQGQLSRMRQTHSSQIKLLQQQNKKILKVQDKLKDMCKRQKNFKLLVSIASADVDFEHLYDLVFEQVSDLSPKTDEVLISFLCKRLDSILILYYLQKRIPYELKDRQKLKSNPKEYLRLRVQQLNNLQS